MNFYPPPEVITAEIYYNIPSSLRRQEPTEWAQGFPHKLEGVFLEGPVVNQQGDLFIVDIPYGRILKIDSNKNAETCAEWDGEPNGLAIMHDGRIIVADYKEVSRFKNVVFNTLLT